jgi:leucyl aminopeptidase
MESARKEGEKLWPLPLEDDYFDMIKSHIADVKNSGGRYGGAITAGLFLQEFVAPGIAWAHLDIAGPALVESEKPYRPTGGTGVMVRTLLRYFESL